MNTQKINYGKVGLGSEYPTDYSLRLIKNWDITKFDVLDLIDFIEKIWWSPDWGFIKKGKHKIRLELHTAGWSGNEDIIRALNNNFLFWSVYWNKSVRGGHYYFTIFRLK